MRSTRLEPDTLVPEHELGLLMKRLDGAGAVVSFVGTVRPSGGIADPVEGLFLDHYPGATEDSIAAIADDAAGRFAISHAWVVHRCGFVAAGEAIVFAAAAATHRREAFLAADYLMDRLKTDALFWKREESGSESRWIEPRERDRDDRARWG